MRRVFSLLLLAALAAAVTGCTSADPPDITGLIYAIEGETFLVVEGIDDTGIPYEEWFENGHSAIFFTAADDTVLQRDGKSISFNQLEIGQKVKVWSTGVLLDSYPQQGTAKRVTVTD